MDKSEYRLRLYLIFEEEARMFGMAMSNFFNFAILAVAYIIAPMLVGGFGIELGWWYYLPGAFLLFSLWIFLKAMGKKAYPNFIFAFLSHRVMQPKKMTAENFQIKLSPISELLKEIEIEENNQQ
jgi:hypothetical protein